jgi:putative solute:sodium symporter small subunit
MWKPGSADRDPDQWPVSGGEPPPQDVAIKRRFWRWVTFWTLLGLAGWLVLTLGVVWCARDLDQWTVAQVPAGYWWAAQGAIGGFLIIIVLYGVIMDRLDARFRRDTAQPPDSRPADVRHG